MRREEDAECLRARRLRAPRRRSFSTSPTPTRSPPPRRGSRPSPAAACGGLVNNAGVAIPSPLETMPIERLPPPDRDQPHRPRRRHPGPAALDPPRRRPHRLHQLDRRPHRLPADRRLPRRQVRDRGGRRRLPPGAAALGDPGLDRRAGLDRHPDLGARRAHLGRDRRPLAAARSALRPGDRELPQGDPPDRRTRDPAGEGGEGDRARAQLPSAPAAATWSGSTPRSRRGSSR